MSGPTRVLFITSDASMVAGVGRSLLDLAEHLDRTMLQPYVVNEWPGPGELTIASLLQELGISAISRKLGYWLPAPSQWGLRHLVDLLLTSRDRLWSILGLIEKLKIDVIYTNGLTCIDGALAARLSKRPHIWHMRESIRDNRDIRSYLPAALVEKLVDVLSDKVIVNSRYLAGIFAKAAAKGKVSVVHNGIDIDKYAAPGNSSRLRGLLACAPGTCVVASIGTITPRKGYEILVDAAERVLEQTNNVAFLIIGNELPGYSNTIRQMIRQKGLERYIHMLGPQNDIAELLPEIDLLVHPAHQETFGRVIVEAMAASKPVVATRSGGPEEIVEDGQTGFLVPVGDSRAMGRAIARLIGDRALARTLGLQGRRRAEALFSAPAYAQKIQDLICNLARQYKVKS